MLNMVKLAEDITANGNQTAVLFGPSATTSPANRIMPGQTVVLALLPSDGYDGVVHVENAEDGSTYADAPEFASTINLATGKAKLVEMKVAEAMRLVTASRTAGSISAYILTGS